MKTKTALFLALSLLSAGCKTYNVQPGGVVNNYAPPPAPFPASYVVTDGGGAVIYAAPAVGDSYSYSYGYAWNPWGNNDSTTTYKYKYSGQCPSAQNCRQQPPAAGQQPKDKHPAQAQKGIRQKLPKVHKT